MNKAKYVSSLSELDEEWLGWIENDFTLNCQVKWTGQNQLLHTNLLWD